MMRQADLLPAVYRRRQRQRRWIAGIVAGGVVILILLIVWWLVTAGQVSDKQRELDQARARNAALRGQVAKLQRFSTLQEQAQRRRSALAAVMKGDVDWPALLTEIAMVVPPEVSLDSFDASAANTESSQPVDTETNPVPLARAAPAGSITFNGTSTTMPGVAKWLLRLAAAKGFDAVYLSSAQKGTSSSGANQVQFTNTAQLDAGLLSHRFEQKGTP